jgi:exonuclease SbcD
MRFVHTADWHLGRILHGQRLIEDQAHALEQLALLIKDCNPEALLICGDVYDRAVPPPDAVELLDEFLSEMIMDLDLAVIVIAGNHDSPIRMDFGAKVFSRQGLHVFGSITDEFLPVVLHDEYGPVNFFSLPYAEPALVREKLACEGLIGQESAIKAMLDTRSRTTGDRSVLLAHAFVSGCEEAESERPLSVGGADCVNSSVFSDFHYVALGHLHRPQSAGGSQIRYSGSLLKYSFSEADHKKVVHLVELDRDGKCEVDSIALTVRRDVRRISGFLTDILQGPSDGESRDDYLLVSLLDQTPILDVMGKIREIYPNTLHVERPYLEAGGGSGRAPSNHRKLSDAELFAAFYEEVTGNELSQEQAHAYDSIVSALRQQDRETLIP